MTIASTSIPFHSGDHIHRPVSIRCTSSFIMASQCPKLSVSTLGFDTLERGPRLLRPLLCGPLPQRFAEDLARRRLWNRLDDNDTAAQTLVRRDLRSHPVGYCLGVRCRVLRRELGGGLARRYDVCTGYQYPVEMYYSPRELGSLSLVPDANDSGIRNALVLNQKTLQLGRSD